MEFIGREKELNKIRIALSDEHTKAILVYGRRRMGKTRLIKEAIKDGDAVKIIYRGKTQPILQTIAEISAMVMSAIGLGDIPLPSFDALFKFLQGRKEKFIIALDEYQDTKKLEGDMADALLRNAMDDMPSNVKLILSGSSIRIMESLMKSDNPLYGRFKEIILVDEMDYYDAAKFYPSYSVRDKITLYSVLGGIPWINESINEKLSVEENIINLMLEDKGLARTYAEDVINVECSTINYSTTVFNAIKNGKKHFSEIQSYINIPQIKAQLTRVLKSLIDVRLIRKRAPINSNSNKSSFYEIRSNIIRFYFAYQDVLCDENTANMKVLYKNRIAQSLNTFVSYRFEEISRSYFLRLSLNGKRPDILKIGSYWYDDKINKKNGEFDVALFLTDETYEIYESKFLQNKASESLLKEERSKINQIPLKGVKRFGLISSSGFDDISMDDIVLVSGEDLYKL